MPIFLMLLLGAWLVLSVAVHVHAGIARRVRPRDRWSLLPVWRFFVANAARYEFSVIQADPDTGPAPAPLLLPLPHPRAPWNVLFNPARLDSKAFSDAAYFAVEARDAATRDSLGKILAGQHDPAEGSQARWHILRRDNLTGAVTVADTLP